ncbi:Gfo/Idh/MocA family oxidoreductase [Pedobacter panaciterrae]|uniref:Gfo/Idh/MocA family protein n=1 Tax=Pedobacter panaciterrae TaxID=363849 RepID=UPI00155D8CE7|nr:Gfo/Idh/MocA family oxidoreductase [Pedobacter panaciterrae]NQX55251.1 Gfo/Idh/MocA family oxidoreductase [Pedobacter panaciterrae]
MDVVIIGLGSISTKHIFALRSLDYEVNIKALRSSRNAGNVDGITNIYDFKDIGQPDFVIISNPTYLHYNTIREVAEQRIPMFIEKPVVHTLENIAHLQQMIEPNSIFTYVACNLRFHPCIQFLKSYLNNSNERINEVNIYCGSFLPDWRKGKNYRDIYSANLNMGGGVHLDLFHEMDLACWLFGLPSFYRSNTTNLSSLKIDAPDYANYLLSFSDFNVSILLNYYRRKPKRTIEILFENTTWTVDLIRNNILTDEGEIIFNNEGYDLINSYVDQMSYFVSHLKDDTLPMNTFSESIEILKITLSNE